MHENDISCDLIMAFESKLGTAWKNGLTNDPFARLYCVTGGGAQCRHDGVSYVLRPGRLYLIPPNRNFSYSCPSAMDILWCHFSAYSRSFPDIWESIPFSYEIKDDNAASTQKLFKKLIAHYNASSFSANAEAGGIILQLLSHFIRNQDLENNLEKNRDIERIRPVLNFIEHNTHRRIRLSELADLASYEETHFSKLFRKIIGKSPISYMLTRKIEKAKFKLLYTDDKIDSIAESLGFADAFHFSKVFKKISGLPPSKFSQKRDFKIP